jgi:hypothetical protein
MSTMFFLLLPERNEIVSVGRIVGWATSSYAQNERLGTLILAALARCPQSGVLILSHEDHEYDNVLGAAKDVTEDYLSLVANLGRTPVDIAALGNFRANSLAQKLTFNGTDALDLGAGSEVGLESIFRDANRLRKISEIAMSRKKEVIKLR